MKGSLSYQRLMTIVHGKSELAICQSIKSNLRLPQEIIAHNNGNSSYQIAGLADFLKTDLRFRSFSSFVKNFPRVEVKSKKTKELKDFSLFIIMDTDDCTQSQVDAFIDKSMFQFHWLQNYIIPIYNTPNLEKTMYDANITILRKKDYFKIFPTSQGDLDINKAQNLLISLERCKNSNLSVYIKSCIDLAKQNLI